MRVRKGAAKKRQRKRLLRQTEGYWGKRHKWVKTARDTLVRGQAFSTAHRRRKKRDFRRLWVIRINAAARQHGMSYSVFMNGVKKAGIGIDRKMLALLAVEDPEAFAQIASIASAQVSAPSRG